jgi:lipoprotein-anchoring transpeptidase ErfK/SrfK
MSQTIRATGQRTARGWLARRLVAAILAAVVFQHLGLPGTSNPAWTHRVEAAEAELGPNARAREGEPQASYAIGTSAPGSSGLAFGGALARPPAEPIHPLLGAASVVWQGTAARDGFIRAAPQRGAPVVGELAPGQPVQVVRWVNGQEVEKENSAWAELSEGRYVYSSLLRSKPVEGAPPAPADAPQSGRWIDVNLTLQIATAYEAATPIKSVLVSSGRPGWETAGGVFEIQRRKDKGTMDGSTLVGQGPDGRGASYKIENVRWIQYFSGDGSAIHENYWRNPARFGIPSSHGCIGMLPADAAWFWDFASVGTPVVIH